ncbi:MAG: hypothetical protein FWG99_11800 [Treponema sp.]|nr:hypothetical protein [Treponema sp.]
MSYFGLHRTKAITHGWSGELQRRKATAVFVVLFAALLFMGCPMEDGETGSLNSVWSNNANGFITTIKIDASAKTIDYVGSYEGKIVNSPNFNAANGVLIIEFTKYIDWDYTSEPYTSSENPEKEGKYGALYWKELKSKSVYMADAYTGWDHAMFDTIENAEVEFTLDKVNNFVDWSIVGLYTK